MSATCPVYHCPFSGQIVTEDDIGWCSGAKTCGDSCQWQAVLNAAATRRDRDLALLDRVRAELPREKNQNRGTLDEYGQGDEDGYNEALRRCRAAVEKLRTEIVGQA